MAIEIGRLCVKIAGRDAGKKCIIIDILDDKFVMIDGGTRRRKCNVLHIEPLNQTVKIEKNASHEEIVKAFKELGLEAHESKPKQKTQKPAKKRKTPEQLRSQKEEKKQIKGLFKAKKKEEKEGQKETLEEKAGLDEEQAAETKPAKEDKPKEKKASAKAASPKKKE